MKGLLALLLVMSPEPQIHPDTVVNGTPATIVLDAPLKGYSEWSLLVRVGETEFAVPRVELRKLAVQHPQWRTK